jgi:hypothetical protein
MAVRLGLKSVDMRDDTLVTRELGVAGVFKETRSEDTAVAVKACESGDGLVAGTGSGVGHFTCMCDGGIPVH